MGIVKDQYNAVQDAAHAADAWNREHGKQNQLPGR
jgi:hypothetical protein